jgi:hypothetical protein
MMLVGGAVAGWPLGASAQQGRNAAQSSQLFASPGARVGYCGFQVKVSAETRRRFCEHGANE